MVRGGVWLVGQGMVVNNTLQLKLFRRKGIQYIQLYTAISREEFFQYMFILYYFGFPCGVLCRGGVWGGGFGRWARPRGENGGSTNSQLVLRLRRRGVFLVLVQNFAARGLVQKPSN